MTEHIEFHYWEWHYRSMAEQGFEGTEEEALAAARDRHLALLDAFAEHAACRRDMVEALGLTEAERLTEGEWSDAANSFVGLGLWYDTPMGVSNGSVTIAGYVVATHFSVRGVEYTSIIRNPLTSEAV